jgi:hypothetical protein
MGDGDVWGTLFRISREYDSIQLLAVSPRIVMMQGEPEMIDIAKMLLRTVSWSRGGGRQCFGYDTQFKVL